MSEDRITPYTCQRCGRKFGSQISTTLCWDCRDPKLPPIDWQQRAITAEHKAEQNWNLYLSSLEDRKQLHATKESAKQTIGQVNRQLGTLIEYLKYNSTTIQVDEIISNLTELQSTLNKKAK